MSAVVHRLDDHRPRSSDQWSCREVYRAGQVVWWHDVPWESLVHGNTARPEVVVEGHLYYSPDWAPVWDRPEAQET